MVSFWKILCTYLLKLWLNYAIQLYSKIFIRIFTWYLMLRVLILTVLLASALSVLAVRETCGTIVGCIECPNPEICITCDGSLNFDRKPNDKGTCSCLTGFYLNRYKCLACDTSKPYCLTCSDDGNICTSCLAGYYIDKGSCSACGSYCESCKSSAACDKCQSGYIWSGKVCESCGITNC